MERMQIGTIHVDYITMSEAIDFIIVLAEKRCGGYVVTPNVDHVVLAERSEELREAYRDATLSLADGMPLIWLSKLLGHPLPEKVSGADIVRPLLARIAQTGLKVYLLGAEPGVGQKAADILRKEFSDLQIVGVDSPEPGFEKNQTSEQATLKKMLSAKPDIVVMGLGCPKQELLMHRWYSKEATPIMLGFGACIDIIAGKSKRAPQWMSNIGAEWLFRLAQEPRRLGRRYLVRDVGFLKIIIRILKSQH